MSSDHRRAVVVGAGIAGLTAALRLRGIGWDVPDARTHALRGGRALNLMRGDIEDVLFNAVGGEAEMRFGASVTSVEQDEGGVHVVLDDGTAEDADLLIGADGLHSTVRELAFGPESSFYRDLGYTVTAFTLAKLPDGLPENTVTTFSPPGRSIAVASLGPDRAAAYFIHKSSDPAAERAQGHEPALTNRYSDLGWVVPELLTQLAESDSIYFDSVGQAVVDRWHKRRIVLVGDAAWCLTPFSGYGGSLAMGGANLLGNALEASPDGIAGALHAWEEGVRPEADRYQKRARRAAALHAPATRTQLMKRDLLLRAATLPPVTHLLAHAHH